MIDINNNKSDVENVAEHSIGTVILFLSFCVLCGCLFKWTLTQLLKNKLPIPFTVIMLIFGFLIGLVASHVKMTNNDFLLGEDEIRKMDPHLFYFIFLPLLIFDSAFNTHFHVVRQQIISGILLAGPGVFISILTIACLSVYVFPYNWSWLIGIMFASILSATDPVAVVALLDDSGANKSLTKLIDLESLLNDGSAFVIFMIFRNIAFEKYANTNKIIVDIVKFTIGGPLFGLSCGILVVTLLNSIHNQLEVEIISTFGLAYFVFYVADVELGVSAVLALVVMGLFMAKHKYCISSHVQTPIANTWRIVVDFINILIFTITGIVLAHSLISTKSTIVAYDFGYSILLYVVLHIGRIFSVICLYPFIRWSGVCLSLKEYIILIWSGLRGSMSVILALMVNSDTQIHVETRHRFLFHICVVTLLTLIINGTSTQFFVKFLGLTRGTSESERILFEALEHLHRRTKHHIDKMKKEKQFSDVNWDMLNEYLPEILIQEMDKERNTDLYRYFSTLSDISSDFLLIPYEQHSTHKVELRETPSVCETENIPINFNGKGGNTTLRYLVLSLMDLESTHRTENRCFQNELVNRFLTALLVDYEKQWYAGMIRRRTLYILIKSIEAAKHHHSIKFHWNFLVERFRLSKYLETLLRFDFIKLMKKFSEKHLFDQIFLTIELVLAFHSARPRMENIQQQFPELANIDQTIWNKVCQQTHFYHLTATYILLDLQQSYKLCWKIQMTKRCAQMLLKYESKVINQLYETGMLSHSISSRILKLIEHKSINLEFYRVKTPANPTNLIENSFDLLSLFRSLNYEEKLYWKTLMKSNCRWFQPNEILIEKNQRVISAFLIVRGIVQCNTEKMPIYFRSNNIIAIDSLFSQDIFAYDTFIATGGIVEAFCIDRILLDELLINQSLAPLIYREIAIHFLSHHCRATLKLNRLQLKLLLNDRVNFYWNKVEMSIDMREDQRLFILQGFIQHLIDDQHKIYESIQLKIFDFRTTVVLHPSTVAFSWTRSDEEFCIRETNLTIDFPLQTSEFLSNDLLYPGYEQQTKDIYNHNDSATTFNNRNHSTEV